jgi:hypothetical protein
VRSPIEKSAAGWYHSVVNPCHFSTTRSAFVLLKEYMIIRPIGRTRYRIPSAV